MGKNGKRIDAANVNAFVVGVGRPAKASKKADQEAKDVAPVAETVEVTDPKPVKAAAKPEAKSDQKSDTKTTSK
jgi:hypothetical protein